MSDPLDRLNQFGSSFEGGAMPQSPAEVRRRGDQIRRRTHALIAGASALAVAAVAVPVIALTSLGGDTNTDRPPVVDTPSSITDPTTTLSIENLLTEDLTVYGNGLAWGEAGTWSGSDGPVSTPCGQERVAEVGATAGFQRTFTLFGTETGEGGDGYLDESVLEFSTADEAKAAFDNLTDIYFDCQPEGSTFYEPGEVSDAGVPGVDQSARLGVMYGPADAAPGSAFDVSGRDDLMWFMDAGFVRDGNRVALLSSAVLTTPDSYAWPEGNPVDRMLPDAADLLVNGGGQAEPNQTEGPSATISAANLLTNDDAIYPNGGGDWDGGVTSQGEQATSSPCQTTSFAELGATDVWQRDFTFYAGGVPTTDGSGSFNETITEYPDAETAAAAYEQILGWYDGCTPPESDTFRPGSWGALEAGDEAQQMLGSYGPVPGDRNAQYIVDTGIVQSGNRVALLSQVIVGEDYIWPEEPGTPVQQMLPVAADRLANGGGDETDETDEGNTATSTEISDDIAIDIGLAERGGQTYGPDRPEDGELQNGLVLCDQAASWPPTGIDGAEILDELAAGADGDTWSDSRDLVTLPTVNDAVYFMSQLGFALDACPGEGSSVYSVQDALTGYDSLTYTHSDENGPGVTVLQFTRVGNAVLRVDSYDAEVELADADPLIEATIDTSMAIGAEMKCDYSAEGC